MTCHYGKQTQVSGHRPADLVIRIMAADKSSRPRQKSAAREFKLPARGWICGL